MVVIKPVLLALLIVTVTAPPALAQARGNSGLPPGPGNPFAASTSGVQGVEANLVLIRGTIAGADGSTLEGSGFTAVATGSGRYTVTFDTPFASPPSVALGVEGFFTDPVDPQFVQVISIDSPAGGVTVSGFSAYIAQPSNDPASKGSPGSQNWHFIAVGPQ